MLPCLINCTYIVNYQVLKNNWPCLVKDSDSDQASKIISGCHCVQEESFTKLVEKYLASIPKPPDAEAKPIGSLQPLPVEFPQGVTREDVK